MTKIAVEGGLEPFGIMVWQGIVTLCLVGALAARKGLPNGGDQWLFCAQIALLGTLIPHFASFTAITYSPAGLVAIIMALIPIFALILGAVFASQTAYLITGFGVIWSILILGERYSGWVWIALALMLVGLTLVRPVAARRQTGLAQARAPRDTS